MYVKWKFKLTALFSNYLNRNVIASVIIVITCLCCVFCLFRLFFKNQSISHPALVPGLHAAHSGWRSAGWPNRSGAGKNGSLRERQPRHVCHHWQVRANPSSLALPFNKHWLRQWLSGAADWDCGFIPTGSICPGGRICRALPALPGVDLLHSLTSMANEEFNQRADAVWEQ